MALLVYPARTNWRIANSRAVRSDKVVIVAPKLLIGINKEKTDFFNAVKRKTAGCVAPAVIVERSDGFSHPCNELIRYDDHFKGGALNIGPGDTKAEFHLYMPPFIRRS